MSMNRGLRFKFALLCQFHSKQNRAWFGKPSVINDNISDFKIRFLLLLIMKLSLLLLSFCHHNPQSSWWLSFFCVKWLFFVFCLLFSPPGDDDDDNDNLFCGWSALLSTFTIAKWIEFSRQKWPFRHSMPNVTSLKTTQEDVEVTYVIVKKCKYWQKKALFPYSIWN